MKIHQHYPLVMTNIAMEVMAQSKWWVFTIPRDPQGLRSQRSQPGQDLSLLSLKPVIYAANVAEDTKDMKKNIRQFGSLMMVL